MIARRNLYGIVICVMLANFSSSAEAQHPGRVPRIGYLDSASPSLGRHEGFLQGLREFGYIEGKNIVIEWKSAEGKVDRLSALVNELVRLQVDVIVTGGATATRTAKQATTIPIVMAQDPDPVGNGFVANLARPGGNITGLSSLTADLSGKRLDLLKEIFPKLSHLAVFETSTNTGNARQIKETELAAGALGVKLQYLDILRSKDIEIAFRAAKKGLADAVLVLNGPVVTSHRKEVVELAVKTRLPATYATREYVEDGGLMSYGVSFSDLDRRAATYVNKILKGAKPADLPVEQPEKFELVINLKTANQIGLTIPPNVLARADRVIK